MSLKVLIDMNLSPDWVAIFQSAGIDAKHWSSVGDPSAPDRELLQWARDNAHIVFTHDLDFGALLAGSGTSGPSVIQLRSQDLLPDRAAELLLSALQAYQAELSSGALVTVDAARSRVRILPI
jgi:predicted nuclease of predicted toxin-antitoxin system